MRYNYSTKMIARREWMSTPAYTFPVIHHINDVLPAIEGREEFRPMDRGDHIVINYVVNLEDTFPHITPGSIRTNDQTTILRRECRGIAFDKASGLIIRRPPHKFFNLNERPETDLKVIDWSSPFIVMEKLDGSCITAYKDSTGRIIWGTPAGPTDFTPHVEKFVSENPQWIAAANYLIDAGWSPTFEFCSRVNRVVIDHPVTRLPLTCVRNIWSGAYLPYEQMIALREFGIEVGNSFQHENNVDGVISIIEACGELDDTEGFILRFDSGHMIKLKTEWYREIHGCVTGIRFEKDALSIILNKRLDDMAPFLTDDMREMLEEYNFAIYDGFMTTAHDIANKVWDDKALTKKEFAAKHHQDPKFSFMADLFDHQHEMADQFDYVRYAFNKMWAYVRDRTFSQTWVDKLRHLYDNKRFEF